MKTEHIVERINLAMTKQDNEQKELFERLKNNRVITGKEYSTAHIMADLYLECMEDVRYKDQKTSGNAKRDTLIKKLFKTAQKEEFVNCYVFCEGGKYGFVDGFRAYICNDNFGYDKSESNFQLEKCFPAENTSDIILKATEAEVKNFISEQKAIGKGTKKSPFDQFIVEKDGEKYGYNPIFLLEFLQFFNISEFRTAGKVSAAYYYADNGEKGILLPVRVKEDF